MGKRYLRVDITRENISEIYLEVDENDPRFSGILNKPKGDFLLRGPTLPEEIHKLALEEAQELDELNDWGPPDFSASWYPVEVKQEETRGCSVVSIELPKSIIPDNPEGKVDGSPDTSN